MNMLQGTLIRCSECGHVNEVVVELKIAARYPFVDDMHEPNFPYQVQKTVNCPGCNKEITKVAEGHAQDDLMDIPHWCDCGVKMMIGFPDGETKIYWLNEHDMSINNKEVR